MFKFFLFIWWDHFPTTNLKVMYRSNEWVWNLEFRKIFIKTAYERCSNLEKEFLCSRFNAYPEFKEILKGN
jgi:hypothetical protein